MFDNDPDTPSVVTPTRTVACDGCFGSVSWNISPELYGILPRSDCDELLDMTSSKLIGPFFTELLQRVIRHLDLQSVDVNRLDSSWSFESQEVACSFGVVIWSIGQGVLDLIPPEQRAAVLLLTEQAIHQFMEYKIRDPLMVYAQKQF